MPRATLLRRLVATTTVALVAIGGLTVSVQSASASPSDPGTITGWGMSHWAQNEVPDSLEGKDVIAVSDGVFHSLALTSDGKVTAWGQGNFGTTSLPDSLSDKTVTAIAAGYVADMALTSDGKVIAWGANFAGQLDIPTSLDDKTVTSIATGLHHSLALTSDGKVTAWGHSGSGQTDVPASLDDRTVTAVSASVDNSMALTSDGGVVVWGEESNGLVDVPGTLDDRTVTAIALGRYIALALTADGKVTAWGTNSGEPNIGLDAVPASLDDKRVVAIDADYTHALALTSGGTVTSWGSGLASESEAPAGLSDVTQISAGLHHNLAIVGGALDFQVGVSATTAGTPQVGETLTAVVGAVAPTPDRLEYQWYADGTPITGAEEPTLTLTAGQRDAAITVEVTAARFGYTASTDVSDPTEVVAAGVIEVTGAVSVDGEARVGEVLTASSPVATAPDAEVSGRWLRDGVPISEATAATYELVNADAGATLTYQVIAVVAGYDDAKVTSDGVGPVGGGVIALPVPTVTGSPVVDGPLTASMPDGVDPSDAEVTRSWSRGATVVGAGSTYTPDDDDAGEPLTVTATAAKPYFDAKTSNVDTATVAEAGFTTAPEATITGIVKVGETLTAVVGEVVPTPDRLEYQWYADGSPITGADEPTWTLTAEQRDAVISVDVTAVRAGYNPSPDTSEPTDDVATERAPTMSLTVAKAALRRGQSTRLAWTSGEASSVTASGGWNGARHARGTRTVRPTTLGGTTYKLSATNANGTTTAQVSVQVTRVARNLRVEASNGLRMRGRNITVTAGGLGRGEHFTIRIAGTKVAVGRANRTGTVRRTVAIPSRAHEGRASVRISGEASDRTGRDVIRVVTTKALGLELARKAVRASDPQTVTVSRLAAGERVRVTYQGRRISPKGAHANRRGSWSMAFDVDIYWGTKTVRATGQFSGRNAKRTFEVVRRCWVGRVCP